MGVSGLGFVRGPAAGVADDDEEDEEDEDDMTREKRTFYYIAHTQRETKTVTASCRRLVYS